MSTIFQKSAVSKLGLAPARERQERGEIGAHATVFRPCHASA